VTITNRTSQKAIGRCQGKGELVPSNSENWCVVDFRTLQVTVIWMMAGETW
jgi:hypothetical protein